MAPAENFENGHSSTQLEEVHHNYTVCIHPLDTQASKDPLWIEAMKAEFSALKENGTWSLFDLSPGRFLWAASGYLRLSIIHLML